MANIMQNSQEIRDTLDELETVVEEQSQEVVPVTSEPNTNVPLQTRPGNILVQSTISKLGSLRRSPKQHNVETTAAVRMNSTEQIEDSLAGQIQVPPIQSRNNADLWKRRVGGRQATSDCWLYFKYDPKDDVSTCQIDNCTSAIKGKNTTNLKNHMKALHKMQYGLVATADKKTAEQLEKLTNVLKTDKSDMTKGQRQLNIDAKLAPFKYDSNHPKQKKFQKQVAILFGSNPLPNYTVANEDFKKAIAIADPRLSVPSRATLEKNIDDLMSEVKKTITLRLSSARKISVASDIWTKKGMSSSYLGVLATFFDTVEERKTNIVLGVKRFDTSHHKSKDIIREMKSVLNSYNVSHQKVWKMITDSGSNMVCAFRDEILDIDSNIVADMDASINNTAEDENEETEDKEDDAPEIDTAMAEYSRLSCFIHTLLLNLKLFDARKLFSNLIAKLKILVSKFSSSQVLTGELIRLSGLKLVSFSNTRWNIVYIVIQRLLKVRESVTLVLQTCGKQKYDLTTTEWNLMLQIQEYLLPFNKYTDMASTEGTRAISEVIMMIKDLKQHLKKYFTVHNFVTVSKDMYRDISKRFEHFHSEGSEKQFEGVYLASTLLDPRFRVGLDSNEIELGKKYILAQYITDEVQQCFSTNDRVEPERKKRKFGFLEEIEQSVPVNPNVSDELNAYLLNKSFDVLDDKLDPWLFWKNQQHALPNLSSLALDILSIPLSIGAVERVFSFTGISSMGKRNRMEGPHLEREAFLSKNKHLIDFS